jgi:hypothetical protein
MRSSNPPTQSDLPMTLPPASERIAHKRLLAAYVIHKTEEEGFEPDEKEDRRAFMRRCAETADRLSSADLANEIQMLRDCTTLTLTPIGHFAETRRVEHTLRWLDPIELEVE